MFAHGSKSCRKCRKVPKPRKLAGSECPREIWLTAGTARGGTGHLGLTHTETQRGRLWTACGQRRVDSKNSQTTPATTSTSSIRQLLGAADAQTAHHATFSTVPTTGLRERRNDTSKSTGRSGRQKAATRRNMRREERVTVQGPVQEQQPDGMSHRGATTSTTPICQLLGAVDAQTAHHATSSTALAHQLLGFANAETTPAGAPAAEADRKQRPDATCGGKNG